MRTCCGAARRWGNFGVVTSYEFQLHQVGPKIAGRMLVHPIEQAGEVLRAYRDYADDGPDELATAFAFLTAPPRPFIPEHLQGKTVLGIVAFHCGEIAEAERVLRPLRRIGPPAADLVGTMRYTDFQALLDPQAPPGWCWYYTGEYLNALTDEAIDVLTAHAPQGLAPLTQIIVFRHGGAVSRIANSESAFRNRESAYLLHPLAAWSQPNDDTRHIAWLRELVQAMEPFKTGGIYLNFSPDDKQRLIDGFDATTRSKLVGLKQKRDPANVFRFNHNIRPDTG
jgi:hypothetical protein